MITIIEVWILSMLILMLALTAQMAVHFVIAVKYILRSRKLKNNFALDRIQRRHLIREIDKIIHYNIRRFDTLAILAAIVIILSLVITHILQITHGF